MRKIFNAVYFADTGEFVMKMRESERERERERKRERDRQTDRQRIPDGKTKSKNKGGKLIN